MGKLQNNQTVISKEQFQNLKYLLDDMVSNSEKELKWISKRRREEILTFLEPLVTLRRKC